MGLKGYRLWVMGQLDSTCTAPPVVLFVRAPHDPPGGCGGFYAPAEPLVM
jgi:hypothetical protein